MNDEITTLQRGDLRRVYLDQLISYDLIEASRSFFSCKPILQALQEMEGVAFASEIAWLKPHHHRPQYLPKVARMPSTKQFHVFQCNLDDWSTQAVMNAMTLDESQTEALRHALTSRVALIQG